MTVKGLANLVGCSVLALGVQAAGGSLRAEGVLIWPSRTNGPIESSPAIGPNGIIYVGTRGNYLFAIQPNGNPKWSFDLAGDEINSTPAVAGDGTVYFGSDDGNLYAVDGNTGAEKWSPFQTGGYVYSSPAIGTDGTIYVGSADKSLYAVNPDNGREVWSFATGDSVESSPAIGPDGTIYVGSDDKSLYAISPAGALKWSFPTGDKVVAPPAVAADGTIYFGSKDGRLYALTPGGNEKWSVNTGGPVETSPAIGPTGTIYFGSLDGFLYAVAPDGTLQWRFAPVTNPTLPINSSPAVRSDGTILLGAGKKLVAVDPNGQQVKWSYATGDSVDSSPVISPDGTIYVGSWDGYLYALSGNGSGPAATAWPLFRHDLARGGRTASSNLAVTNPGRLLNMSVLDPLSFINPVLTVGLVSGGQGTTGSQNVLIRGVGPTLSAFDLSPVVQNTVLTVFNGSTVIAANDDWASSPENEQAVAAAESLVYAFPLTDPSGQDSATVLSLPGSSSYSVQVIGSNPGYALAEVYDATPAGAFSPSTPRLINLSCLATLSPNGFLTAGFIIGGSTPETVMIRATGPALTGLGVSNVLPDPTLSLHSTANNQDQILATDSGWSADQRTYSAIVYDSRSVGAFALPDPNSRDSALLVTLAPGAYTAQVQSGSGAAGATLIEVYEIP